MNRIFLHIAEIVDGFIRRSELADFDKKVLNPNTLISGKERVKINMMLTRIINNLRKRLLKKLISVSVFLDTIPVGFSTGVYTVLKYNDFHVQGSRYKLSNYRYYATKDGDVDVKAVFSIQYLTTGTFERAEIAIFKNGSYYKSLDYIYEVDNILFLNGSANVYLNCGDYIDIRFKHNATLPINSGDVAEFYGYLDIHFAGCNRTKIADITKQFNG